MCSPKVPSAHFHDSDWSECASQMDYFGLSRRQAVCTKCASTIGIMNESSPF